MNTTTVTFSSGQRSVTAATTLYQYDYGQILIVEGLDLPSSYEVHFSNQEVHGSSITSIGNEDGVLIPDPLFMTGADIYAFIYLHESASDGETEYKIILPVMRRPWPSDNPPTPEQQTAISQAIVALNEASETLNQASGAAEEAADNANGYATLARSWATGGTETRENEEINNAYFWARVAQQGAGKSGYAYFYIDNETGEVIVTVAHDLDNDVRFEINEEAGTLEVVFV